MKNIILMLFLSLGVMEEIKAQCGTKTPAKDPLEGKILQSMPATASFRYRIFVTILRDDDGTNAACTEEDIMAKIAEMNADFAPTFCFNLMGIKYRDNTNLNTDMNVESNSDITSLTNSNEGGCLDIYVHKALRGGSNTNVTGSAYDIPNHYLSIENVGNHTLSHEMGHCMGLFHTHETYFGLENVNGSNCGSDGDKVCDTAADPADYRTCRTQSTCGYTGTCNDPNAQNYNPPTNNIMSYYGCVNTFTGGQFSKMFNTVTLSNPSTNAANIISSYNEYYPLLAGTTISSGIETYATGGDMQFGSTTPSSFNFYVVTPTGTLYAQANKIRLLPGFRATAGTVGKVRIKTLTCN